MLYGVTFDSRQVVLEHPKGKGALIHSVGGGQYETIHFDRFKHDDCILMQFSGVLDINGVKIWEGDILFWSYIDEDENLRLDRYEVVIFQDGAFGTDGDWTEPTVALCRGIGYATGNPHFEAVVGNIYEHAHLLELSGEYPLATHLIESTS